MRINLFYFLILTSFFFYPQTEIYQADKIPETLLANANAVVRLDKMVINVDAVDKMEYDVEQAITVLNNKGDSFSRFRVPFDNETKIKSLDVFVYDGSGEEIEHIKKKDFQDLSAADGFSLYTDNRLLYHKYTPTSYPYTIALSYSVATSDTAFFPPWYFLSDYLVSVEKSHYEISYATEGLKPEVKEYNLDKINTDKVDGSGKMIYTAQNIPALKYEKLAPSLRDVTARLSLRLKKFSLKGSQGEVHSWEDIGNWMNNALLKNRAELPASAVSKAKSLVKGVEDDLEKAKIIYKYVQDNTRYISVQIGIGGWKPINAIDVDKVKYADCKGLSNYTHALLKAVGVASYYTVIQAGKRKVDFDADFSALQGNHAILAIPYNGQLYWIDCTSQTHPFGFVGDFTDDRLALIVTPEGGRIVNTVAYINEQNYQRTTAEYSINKNGDITGNVKISTEGVQYDNRFHLEKNHKEDVTKHYKSYWSNINNLTLEKYHFSNDMENVLFKEEVAITAANYGTKSGERILFVINAFDKNTHVPDRYRNRKMPLEIQRGYLDEGAYNINLPKDYSMESMPSDKIIETEFGHYRATYVYNDTDKTILFKKSMLIREGKYPKEKYKEYRAFRKKIASAENAKVVLVNTSK